MNLRPPRAQQRLPPRGELCDPPSYPLREASSPPLHAVPPPYHPATLLLLIRTIPKKKFCPIFGVNLRILPIWEHAATHLPPRPTTATCGRSGVASQPLLPRGGCGLRLPPPASLRRDGPLTQDLRPPPPGHKRSKRGPRQAPHYPPRAPSLPSYHLSFGPSNFRQASLLTHKFSFNYYKTVN